MDLQDKPEPLQLKEVAALVFVLDANPDVAW
jgi:hypothetical protein